MKMMSSRVEIILDNTPFPGAGQSIGGCQVIESMIDVEGKNWAVYLKGRLSQAQVKSALSSMTNTHFALPVSDEFSLVTFQAKGLTHARTNPPGDVTVVRGHMYYARPNPISSKDFQAEMDEMLIDDPEKFFTKYKVRNTDELHDRLWKGVSYAGEAYGWKKGEDLYHRRASFIMPKIKINKALKGATMFYHTHPAKDEPSLTSADDIQFYLDLHFAYGIKSFYTVMKHKLDHFTITGKKGGKEKYLRMEEDAFIDAVDGMIAEGEKMGKKEVGKDRPEVEFQNRITREMVDLFNKKFSSIAKISFRPKSKNPASKLARKSSNNPIAALANPAPNPPIKVEDQYVAKALDELKGLDYAHEHYGADEYGHTMYVYWWLKHHLAPTPKQPKGRLFKLNEFGMDSDTRKKLRQYLSQPIVGNYNYMDAVYLLALYHDIAKLREKGTKKPGWELGAEMFRNEIGPELNLPSKLTEDIAFMFDTDLGRKGITDEDFLTQSGDYYGACKLVQMADMITHHPTMYTKQGGQAYKREAMVNMIDQLRDFLDHHYVIENPPPQVLTLKWVADFGLEDIAYEEAEELLGEFHQSVIPDNDGKTKQRDDKSSGGHLYRLRFNSSVIPGLSRYYAGNLSLSSSKLLIDVGKPVPDDLGKKDADAIYRAVGERLRESYPEVVIDEVEPEVLVNPRHSNKIQVISISGPTGGGKSTVLKYLHRHLPNSSIPPTYTTRPRRKSDGPDRKFVSKTAFKQMIGRGEFVEHTMGESGHYYGRRFKDFSGDIAIIEVSLAGKKAYEKRFGNVFSVYLDPDPKVTEEERAKAIFSRGGLTKEGAKRRAKKATELIEKSKKMQFDLRVTMMKGKYDEGAKKILSELPLMTPQANPGTNFSLIPPPYGAFRNFDGDIVYAENVHRSRNQAIVAFNQQQQEAYDAGTHIPWRADRREDFNEYPGSILPPSWYHREFSKSAPKYGLIPKGTFSSLYDFVEENPKDLFDWFEDWAELINMKNKEMKAFMKSPWFKVAGLTPKEAKAQGIRSGQNSFRAIIRMRKKLGLTGPKDYVDYRKPRLVEDYYAKAIDNWSKDDWEWCKAQVRFNKRHGGFPYNDDKEETKGPLIKKQKTQNQPSKRLLGLWVWAHDPWRWARKKGIVKMPKCPNVPWVGMTEKRKYGKIEVIDGPKVKNNPKVQVKKDEYRSYFIDEEGNDLTGIPFEKVTLKEKDSFATFEGKMTKKEANKLRSGQWYRVNVAARPSKEPIIQVAPLRFSPNKLNEFTVGRTQFFNNLEIEGPVYPLIFTQVDSEPSSVLLVQGELTTGPQPPLGIVDDISDWQGNVKGAAPHFESGRIRSRDKIEYTLTFAPENGKLRLDAHLVNQTKNSLQNISTLTITDEGDHYFLHEVQVAPKFRRQGHMTQIFAWLLRYMPDRLPGHPKKPIRTLVRAQEGIPQEMLLELFEKRFGFRKLEEVDGGVLMEFNWPVSTITNPPKVTGASGQGIELDTNLQYISYTGNTKLPTRLPYQLVKKLRALLARDREYVGFVKNNKIYYGTSFEYTMLSQPILMMY